MQLKFCLKSLVGENKLKQQKKIDSNFLFDFVYILVLLTAVCLQKVDFWKQKGQWVTFDNIFQTPRGIISQENIKAVNTDLRGKILPLMNSQKMSFPTNLMRMRTMKTLNPSWIAFSYFSQTFCPFSFVFCQLVSIPHRLFLELVDFVRNCFHP